MNEIKKQGVQFTESGRARINQAKGELGLSQVDLAEKLGCTQGKVSALLIGKQSIPYETCMELYNVLEQNSDVEFLLHYAKGKDESYWGKYLQLFHRKRRKTNMDSDQEKMEDRIRLIKLLDPDITPLYEKIKEAYGDSEIEQKARIMYRLETIIIDYGKNGGKQK